jgi:hypothetical protein
LLAALQIKAILEKTTIRDRREAFQATTYDLYGLYQNTIDRINQHPKPKAKQAMEVLKWVFLAKRPLKSEELRHALAIRPGDRKLDIEGLPSEKSLLDCCLGLVTIGSGKFFRFVHKSLQDYLKIQQEQRELFKDGNTDIANTCIDYMMSLQLGSDVDARRDYTAYNDDEFCFLEYAYRNWGDHTGDSTEPNIDSW